MFPRSTVTKDTLRNDHRLIRASTHSYEQEAPEIVRNQKQHVLLLFTFLNRLPPINMNYKGQQAESCRFFTAQ